MSGRRIGGSALRLLRRTLGVTTVLLLVAGAAFLARGSSAEIVSAPDTVQPGRLVAHATSEAGRIVKAYVSEGDRVRAGDTLLLLRSDPLDEQAAQLRGAVHEAAALVRLAGLDTAADRVRRERRVLVADARVDAARASLRERMASFGIVGSVDSLLGTHTPGRHVELDRAVAEFRLAALERESAEFDAVQPPGASVEIARARVGLARALASESALLLRRERLAIIASVDGTVVTRDLERLVGTFLQVGAVAVELASIGPWNIEVPLAESDVDRVRIGSEAVLEFLALPADEERELRGEVRSVALTPTSPSTLGGAATLFTARIAITDPSADSALLSRLRTGYSVRVRISGTRTSFATELWRRIAAASGNAR